MGVQRAGEERLTPLDLFFDLVFLLSFTQVTLKMADHPGWQSLGEGLLILAAVTALLSILIAYEAVHFREQRARVRANPSASLAEMRGG